MGRAVRWWSYLPAVCCGVVAGFDDAVVVWADQDEVVQGGHAAGPPGHDVVGVAGVGCLVAAGEHAPAVTDFEGGFAMARTKAPSSTWDKSLYESRIRTENSVTVVGVKRANEDYIFAAPTTVIRRDDEVIVAGRTGDVDAFCRLT